MNRVALLFALACATAPAGLMAQSDSSSSTVAVAEINADEGAGEVRSPLMSGAVGAGPFSRFAFGAGVSPLGVGLQVATNINEHLVRDVALPIGLVDIKVCAVDEVWTGLKLVIRKELR